MQEIFDIQYMIVSFGYRFEKGLRKLSKTPIWVPDKKQIAYKTWMQRIETENK